MHSDCAQDRYTSLITQLRHFMSFARGAGVDLGCLMSRQSCSEFTRMPRWPTKIVEINNITIRSFGALTL